MRFFSILLGLTLTFLLLYFTPTTEAQTTLPPGAIAGDIIYVDNPPFPTGSYAAAFNFSFRFSPQDSDQTSGAFQYSLYQNTTSTLGNGCTPTASYGCTGWLRINFTDQASGKVGWGRTQIEFSGPQQPNNFDRITFNLTAWNGTEESQASCLINLSARTPGLDGHMQCGNLTLQPTYGLNALVNLRSNSTTQGDIRLQWTLSPSDNQATNGTLNYRVYNSLLLPNGTWTQPTNQGLDPSTVLDTVGLRGFSFTDYSGSSPFVYQWFIVTEDPRSREWSGASCTATVNTGRLYDLNGCGSLLTANLSLSGGTYPFTNLTQVSQVTGISMEYLGWGISLLTIGLLSGLGFIVTKGLMGSLIMGLAGVVFCGLLGILPLWAIILLVLISLTTMVYGTKGASS